jgi:ATP-dependent RNA helicase RhlE
LTKFSDLGLSPAILKSVEGEGYTTPTPIQAQAIPPILLGRDLLGCAQTGTGKTAAFALPIIQKLLAEHVPHPNQHHHRDIRAVILSPTRELTLQIEESFKTYGRGTQLRSVCIFGGVGQGPQTRALKNGVDVVVATPGRLIDLMDQGYLNFSKVQMFVLDEADRMLDMGFIQPIRRIASAMPKERQNLLFSATMPKEIRHLADSMLKDPVKVEVAPVGTTAELIEQSIIFVRKSDKPRMLIHVLEKLSIERALIFTRTKHGADRVTRDLNRAGIPAEAIHGNKRQNVRQRSLQAFKSGKIWALVATDVAARGIDVEGISHVINFELPNEPDSYVHRIGRTARAGAKGQAIAFCDRNGDEREFLKQIERLIRKPIPENTEFSTNTLPAPQAGEQAHPDGYAADRGPSSFNNRGRSQPREQRGFHRDAGRGQHRDGPRTGGFRDGPRPFNRDRAAPAQGQPDRPRTEHTHAERPGQDRPQRERPQHDRPRHERPHDESAPQHGPHRERSHAERPKVEVRVNRDFAPAHAGAKPEHASRQGTQAHASGKPAPRGYPRIAPRPGKKKDAPSQHTGLAGSPTRGQRPGSGAGQNFRGGKPGGNRHRGPGPKH